MARAVVITAFLMLLSGGSWWAADVAEGHLGSATVRRISHRAPCASSNLALCDRASMAMSWDDSQCCGYCRLLDN